MSGWMYSNLTKPNPIHLFWALNFLKNYETESVCASKFGGVDEKKRYKNGYGFILKEYQIWHHKWLVFKILMFIKFVKNSNKIICVRF